MRKRHLKRISAFILFTLLILTGCSQNESVFTEAQGPTPIPTQTSTPEPSETSATQSDNYEDVYLTLDSIKKSEDGGKEIIIAWHNGTDKEIQYGENFSVYLVSGSGINQSLKYRSELKEETWTKVSPYSQKRSLYKADDASFWEKGEYLIFCEFYGEDGNAYKVRLEFTLRRGIPDPSEIVPPGEYHESTQVRLPYFEETVRDEMLKMAVNRYNTGDHRPLFMFNTYDEYEKFKGVIGVTNNENMAYDKEFFEGNTLFAVYTRGSGSHNYEVKTLDIDGENMCIYIYNLNDPDFGSDDDVTKLVLVELEKSRIKDCTAFDAIMFRPMK